jgi:hypothetical protein
LALTDPIATERVAGPLKRLMHFLGHETDDAALPDDGMAADDDMVILNPYSTLNEREKQAVLMNEAARVHMRKRNIEPPRYDLTPEQTEAFKNYGGGDADAMRQTLAARILSGDPSAGKATPEQQEYANLLRSFMGVK